MPTTLLWIEVMKMYMPLRADEAGTVHFLLSEGAVISPGDIIATIELDHPELVVKSQEFSGDLFGYDTSETLSEESVLLPHLALKRARGQLEKVLDGFPLTEDDMDNA